MIILIPEESGTKPHQRKRKETMTDTNISLAIAHLDARPLDEEGDWYAYDEGHVTYVVDDHDLRALGRELRAGTPFAYSLWCSETDTVTLEEFLASEYAMKEGSRRFQG